jgi:hypothetical protein
MTQSSYKVKGGMKNPSLVLVFFSFSIFLFYVPFTLVILNYSFYKFYPLLLLTPSLFTGNVLEEIHLFRHMINSNSY